MQATSSLHSRPLGVSVVVPVFNSAPVLNELCERISATLAKSDEYHEIILVEDCSSDESWRVAQELERTHLPVQAIRMPQNSGQHIATLAGIRRCTGEIIVTMDDDLQHPPEEIPKLLEAVRDNLSVAIGAFDSKQHSKAKNTLSTIKLQLENLLFPKDRGLTISGFKALRSDVTPTLIRYKSSAYYLPAALYLHLPKERIGNVKICHAARKSGRSHYTLLKSIKFAWRLGLSSIYGRLEKRYFSRDRNNF